MSAHQLHFCGACGGMLNPLLLTICDGCDADMSDPLDRIVGTFNTVDATAMADLFDYELLEEDEAPSSNPIPTETPNEPTGEPQA